MTDSNITLPSLRDFDLVKYRVYVEDFDISEAQKGELLRTLWDIMQMFVEMGFEVPCVEDLIEPSENGEEQE